ncbi:MAG: hypothetical protein A2048_09125 [Deltaproteobacteria bacterium GWA2_45_12]|nr:MAG: hypothetical protein A2048_09125 [Deltaproteobacteria bacterium GWA2_45_12]
MTYAEAALLGFVQGATEFLPVSSSAHLVLAPWFFRFEDPGLTFDVALHFGTLLAIVGYFWKDWFHILSGSFHLIARCSSLVARGKGVAHELEGSRTRITSDESASFNLFLWIIIGTIPAMIAGLLLDEWAETTFRNPLLIAFNMAAMGFVLMVAGRKGKGHRHINHVNMKDGLWIGLSQCLALVPGVSRSGVTITAGLFRHMDRVTAARFSFLLATPITFGACLLKLPDFIDQGVSPPALVGMGVSALTGFLCIKYLLRFVQKYSFDIFAYYRFVVALVILGVWFIQ